MSEEFKRAYLNKEIESASDAIFPRELAKRVTRLQKDFPHSIVITPEMPMRDIMSLIHAMFGEKVKKTIKDTKEFMDEASDVQDAELELDIAEERVTNYLEGRDE